MLQTPEIPKQNWENYNNIRSADILRNLGWDTLEERRSKQLAISVFKSLNNLTLRVLKNPVMLISQDEGLL